MDEQVAQMFVQGAQEPLVQRMKELRDQGVQLVARVVIRDDRVRSVTIRAGAVALHFHETKDMEGGELRVYQDEDGIWTVPFDGWSVSAPLD